MEGVDFTRGTRADFAGVQRWKMHRLNKAYTPFIPKSWTQTRILNTRQSRVYIPFTLYPELMLV